MEEHLSLPLIITGNQSKLEHAYTPEVAFSNEHCYEVALTRLETYYSFANITPENCHFRISIDKGKTWKLMSIPTGSYELEAINENIQRLIVEYGGKEKMINLLPNVNTFKCILNIENDDYQIDLTVDNCIRTVLGFNANIYKSGRHEGDKLVDILSINSILVHCNIIGATRLNGIEAPIIYNFFPNSAPGDKIVEVPTNLIYIPIIVGSISSLTCWLTDQDGHPIDLRGEKLTISLHVRSRVRV